MPVHQSHRTRLHYREETGSMLSYYNVSGRYVQKFVTIHEQWCICDNVRVSMIWYMAKKFSLYYVPMRRASRSSFNLWKQQRLETICYIIWNLFYTCLKLKNLINTNLDSTLRQLMAPSSNSIGWKRLFIYGPVISTEKIFFLNLARIFFVNFSRTQP